MSFLILSLFVDFSLTFTRMTELVKTVSKKEVPTHSKRIIFEICADDLTEEDVEIPYVALKWRD